MIDLNVGALTDLCRAVAPGMIERKSGAILNVASTAAFQPGPNMAVYFATKAFVLSLSEALHEELKPHGIKVSCLCPGPTRTEFGEVAGFGGNGCSTGSRWAPPSRRDRLEGLDENKAVVVPGLINKVGAVERALRAALGRSQDRRGDQILISIETAPQRRRCAMGMTRRVRRDNA